MLNCSLNLSSFWLKIKAVMANKRIPPTPHPQLKSLFEIFTFVSERNIKYQYLILALLILVACYRNSVSRFSIIQLRLIYRFNTDFESYFMSVTNFRIVFTSYRSVYVGTVNTSSRDMENLKCFFFNNIIYGLFNTTEIKYRLFPKLI
jgi:hypothetical protein